MKANDLERQFHQWEKSYGGPVVWLTAGAILLLVFLAELWANGKLVKRMGYPGIWSLFLWMPCASYIFWAGMAFWRWPNQKGR